MNGCGLRDEAAFGRLCRGKKAKGFAAEFGPARFRQALAFAFSVSTRWRPACVRFSHNCS
jgi:hypothetical protein